MSWSPSDISGLASKDFEGAWMKTIDLIPSGGYSSKQAGKPHAEAEFIQKLRIQLISAGYTEVALPVFVDEAEARQQRGPEARLALLDSYAVSAFPRSSPPAANPLEKMRAIAPSFNEAKLEELKLLAADFSRGELDSDALLSCVVEKTGVRMDQASEIVTLLFSESPPKATGLLLRNGLVESWFETLAVLAKKESPPLQLFSIGLGFRRGGNPGYVASGAVVSDAVSVEDGRSLVTSLFSALGIEPSFEKVAATSKLFIPGTELVVSCRGAAVGRIGMLSPIALSAYGVATPVFVFELIVARLGVLLGMAKEENEFHQPQFFGEWMMPDAELARLVRISTTPFSWGKEVASKIIKTCSLYSQQQAPCEFKLLEKDIGDNRVEVWLLAEQGTLCGRDYDNELFVYDGNLVSSPAMGASELEKEAVAKGTRTGISFVRAFADYAGCVIEQSPAAGQRVALGKVSDPADANIAVPELVRRYIKSKGRSLGVSGDVGLIVESRVKRLWRHEQPR
ncbi:MAG: hypothetical protein KAW41_07045 [Candidatus Diapherotrites archaeon]|nr:hypothetical protein [Candidatus Diapherotrites archaeon]